jgi:6-phosphogluconolactonase
MSSGSTIAPFPPTTIEATSNGDERRSSTTYPSPRTRCTECEAKHPISTSREYDALLRSRLVSGGFDVAVLGIGDDGHTASLFPGEPGILETKRWVIAVPSAPAKKREARLTVTIPVIEAIGSAFLLVAGKGKHEALQRAWSTSGSVSDTPARLLRGIRGSLTWIIDKAAGGMD